MGEKKAEKNVGTSPYLPWISVFPLNITDLSKKNTGGNNSTDNDTSNPTRNIPTSISIYPVVVNVYLYKFCLIITVVDDFLSGLEKIQIENTHEEIGEKKAIEISQRTKLHN